ncbi:MAG: hypothetical protein AAF585_01965 [Verrucomicrobiota bacterium]
MKEKFPGASDQLLRDDIRGLNELGHNIVQVKDREDRRKVQYIDASTRHIGTKNPRSALNYQEKRATAEIAVPFDKQTEPESKQKAFTTALKKASPALQRAIACRMAWRVFPFTGTGGKGVFDVWRNDAPTHLEAIERAILVAGLVSESEAPPSFFATDDAAEAASNAAAYGAANAFNDNDTDTDNDTIFAASNAASSAAAAASKNISAYDAAIGATAYAYSAYSAYDARIGLHFAGLRDVMGFRSPSALLQAPFWVADSFPVIWYAIERRWLDGLKRLKLEDIGQRYLDAKAGTLDWEKAQQDVFGQVFVRFPKAESAPDPDLIFRLLCERGLNKETIEWLQDPAKAPEFGASRDPKQKPNPLWVSWRDVTFPNEITRIIEPTDETPLMVTTQISPTELEVRTFL